MKCITPITIKSPEGYTTANLLKPKHITTPCGHCFACLSNKRNEWSFRLGQEAKSHIYSYFLTLTYSDECLEYNILSDGELVPTINKLTFQKFLKRLRKSYSSYGKIRYYAIGEYGTESFRPHYHALLYSGYIPIMQANLVEAWPYGNVALYPISPAAIHYVTKYHLHRYDYPLNADPPFALMSMKPGLGLNYVTDNASIHNNIKYPYVTALNGMKLPMPRYYQSKLFTDQNGLKQQLAWKTIHFREKEFEEIQREILQTSIEEYNEFLTYKTSLELDKNYLEQQLQLTKGKL